MNGRSRPLPAPARLVAATILLCAAAGIGAVAAEGQEVEGRVVHEGTREGIRGAHVQLIDDARRVVASAETDLQGGFRLDAGRSGGPFQLQVGAAGYRRTRIDSLYLAEGEYMDLGEIPVAPDLILLDTLRVEAERGGIRSGRETMNERALQGQGIFLSGSQIRGADAPTLTEYFGRLEGLMVRLRRRGGRWEPYVHSTESGGCMKVLVNEWPVDRTGYRTLDDVPEQYIAGVEVYPTLDEVPPDLFRAIGLGGGGCWGAINIWTTSSW